MKIENNILKHYLKNVYFITGSSLGGESQLTVKIRLLNDMIWFSAEKTIIQR